MGPVIANAVKQSIRAFPSLHSGRAIRCKSSFVTLIAGFLLLSLTHKRPHIYRQRWRAIKARRAESIVEKSHRSNFKLRRSETIVPPFQGLMLIAIMLLFRRNPYGTILSRLRRLVHNFIFPPLATNHSPLLIFALCKRLNNA